MTSRIDELQRLHEAATPGEWFQDEDDSHWLLASHHLFPKPDGIFLAQFGGESMDTPRPNDVEAIVALHNSWPAIHRVLLAARAWDKAPYNSVAKLVIGDKLSEELRALDGDKGAT